ncbi:hypothetical protein HDV01_003204 [Terramyces sp. JEL0728]|nr:hypothetical protein HDV01_003204 [Terramyces sp. JEL0728]
MLSEYSIQQLEIVKNLDYKSIALENVFSVLHQTALEKLVLKNCFLADDILLKLARNLPDSKVKYLDLSFNMISDIGAIALANVLPNSKLQHLNLNGNQISTFGVKHLSLGLPQSDIEFFDINTNRFRPDDWHLLYEQLPKCKIRTLAGRIYGQKSLDAMALALPRSKMNTLEIDIHEEYIERFLEAVSSSTLDKLTFIGYAPVQGAALPRLIPALPVETLELMFANLGNDLPLLFANLKYSNLKYLHIRDYSLGDFDFRNTNLGNLQKLTFGLSEFQEDFLEKFGKVVVNSELKELEFVSNRFGKVKVLQFVNEIKNSNLRHLKVGISDLDVKEELKLILGDSQLKVVIKL